MTNGTSSMDALSVEDVNGEASSMLEKSPLSAPAESETIDVSIADATLAIDVVSVEGAYSGPSTVLVSSVGATPFEVMLMYDAEVGEVIPVEDMLSVIIVNTVKVEVSKVLVAISVISPPASVINVLAHRSILLQYQFDASSIEHRQVFTSHVEPKVESELHVHSAASQS